MEIPVSMIVNNVPLFLLIFVRMTGLFVLAPIFGRRNVPTQLKIVLAFILALILVNTMNGVQVTYNNYIDFGILILKEFLVGITIGYISYLIFTGIYLAGQLIDMQIGFGIVNVIDPVSNIQIPITANFYFIISMLVFLSANGHHILIKAIFDSYKFVPVSGAVFGSALLQDIIRIFGEMFLTGFKIAAPIIAAVIIVDITLGIISKTVPQLNVFLVGIPLKLFIGILVMIITAKIFFTLNSQLIEDMGTEAVKILKDMGTVR